MKSKWERDEWLEEGYMVYRAEGNGLKSRQRDLGYMMENFLWEGAL